MEQLTKIVSEINGFLWGMYCLIPLLCGVGIYFTLKLDFIQIRRFGLAVKSTFGGLTLHGERAGKQGMSSFQSLATAIAAQVGTGNLAGAATAIAMGGPGAIFWMWIAAFFGMATIFAEAVLAQTYKTTDDQGHVTGGPAYYISKGLGSKKLAAFFSISIIIALGFIGNMVQSNSIADAFQTAFSLPPLLIGVIISALAAFVFFGGMGRIAAFTEKVVPIMAALYLLGGLIVLLANASHIIPALKMVFVGAFDPAAATGGIIGAGVKEAMRYGVARGLFSNEAGEGSVPNAAATADVSHPIKQGLVQSFGVYVDTWIVCSATAFIVLLTGQYTIGGELTGIALAQASLASIFGPMAPAAISILILMFAFSSIVGNYYYGEINIAFFEGNTKKFLLLFRAGVVLMVFFGCMAELALVWNLADLFMGFLCLTNLYAVLRLSKYARIALFDYVKQKREGHKEPTFDPAILGDEDGVHAWGVDKIK